VSGWIALLVLILAALALLWALQVRGPMLQLAGAALLFGAAGYAVQGRPSLAGSPRMAQQRQAPIALTTLRHAFYGRFGPTEHWLLISESYARRGQMEDSVGVLESAVREHPGDPVLWVGLGNALADHAGGLTPASELAYRRAIELAPDHPAPRFFLGLALARSGAPRQAIALWRSVLAEAPADASWRPFVEDAIAALQDPQRRRQAATGS
jgi:cytochrome c-type biogenesis protein CcmH